VAAAIGEGRSEATAPLRVVMAELERLLGADEITLG
jgi:hypothetical protein